MPISPDSSLTLNVAGETVQLEFKPLAPKVLRTTGQEARRGEVDLRVGASYEDAVQDALHDASGTPPDSLLMDATGGAWRVETWSTVRRGDGGVLRIQATLCEVPKAIAPTRIQFKGHDFDVTFFSCEEPVDQLFSFAVEFPTSGEETERFIETYSSRTADEYFPVRLVGLDLVDEAFRFGQAIWQLGDGPRGSRLWRVTFVAEDGDDPQLARLIPLGDPKLRNVGRMALIQRRQSEALLEELVRAGILDHDARQRVLQAGLEALDGHDYLDLNEVHDVTEHR